jgi:hypothetical protein
MRLFSPVGSVVSQVLLAVVYFVVVTPLALVMRASGRDPLERRLDPAAPTYWIRRDGVRPMAGYFRQF